MVAAKDTYFISIQLVLDAYSFKHMQNHKREDQIELHCHLRVEKKILLKSHLETKAGHLTHSVAC